MLTGDIAKQYLAKYRNASSLLISRKLHDDHPLLFGTVENARRIVRYYRGAAGKSNRKALADREYIRELEVGLETKYNPFGLPEPVSDNWTPVSLPFNSGRGLVIGDLHIPYHDQEAVTVALQWAREKQYNDFVIINGDLNDFYQLSRYEKDPRARTYDKELDDTKKLFDALERAFPQAHIVVKFGNHDNRLKGYLRQRAPELLNMEKYIHEDYLEIPKRGFFTVAHDVPIKVGKLSILHGHEIQSLSTAVNPARGAYLKALECVLLAHCHRTSQHAETSMNGRLDTAWSIGCLCQLHPEYARINKWNHGMAGLEFDGDDFQIENKRIVKGAAR